MRIVFFGSGAFGLPTLEALRDAHEIQLVVSQPDRPAGRRRHLMPTPVAAWAVGAGLPVSRPDNVNDEAAVAAIRGLDAAAFVVIAYGQKMGPALLDGVFAINLHGSLLPGYRGAAPINWAMIRGERETGVSVITVIDRMDAGDVLAMRATPIGSRETAGELHDRLARLGPEAVLEVLAVREAGTLAPVVQNETQATRAPKLTKADGTTGFDQPANQVRHRVHGLTPWPGCTVRLGDSTLKLVRLVVETADEAPEDEPGTLHADGTVTCAPGRVRLLEVQPPGGRAMSFEEYARGHPPAPGAQLAPM